MIERYPPERAGELTGLSPEIIVTRFDQMSTRFAAVGWDRAMLSELAPGARIHAVPTGVDTSFFAPDAAPERKLQLEGA